MKTAISIICAVSAVIILFLFWLIYFQEAPESLDVGAYTFLPAMNAVLNALSATFVVMGLVAIKARRPWSRRVHGSLMALATVASALFLVGYIAHHTLNGDSIFTGQGWVRPLYFTILISHIICSVVVVPLLLITLFAAAVKRFEVHMKFARITYPIWLYVSVTGVLVFVFLRLM
jgi:putative membrane protein